jgi:hypothetical protein
VLVALRQDLLIRDASIRTDLEGIKNTVGEMKQTTETKFLHMQQQLDALKIKNSQDLLAMRSYADSRATPPSTSMNTGVSPAATLAAPYVAEIIGQRQQPARSFNGFVPTKAFLRGWSPYSTDISKRTGLITEVAEKYANYLVLQLSAHLKNMIVRVSAPSFQNFQTTLFFGPNVGKEDCWTVVKSLNDIAKSVEPKHLVMNLFVVMEQSDFQKQRNTALRAADSAWKTTCTRDHTTKTDWASGSLWCENPLRRLGWWKARDEKWEWFTQAVEALDCDIDKLAVEMATSLSR